VSDTLHILGVRHHGPGSARSVVRAMEQLKPDCVLIEGPPDADELIAHVAKPSMQPPVAILVHDAAEPARAVYYPFARFSPEWQAMRWAVGAGVAVRFMDLPQWHRIPVEAERVKKLIEELEAAAKGQAAARADPENGEDANSGTGGGTSVPPEGKRETLPQLLTIPEPDPLQQLAQAAGFDDGERWWEHVVEHRRHDSADVFLAIRDAMAELRKGRAESRDEDEPLREAWMRRTIREAKQEGFKTMAVVCGAWHAPVLDPESVPRKDDDDRLKGLPKIKTSATWVPWTYDRLTYASGYGAGVRSPGWYDHLWTRRDDAVIEAWMTRVAQLLREKDIDCASSHVIEAVRLSETLATIRGRPLADLSDIADATRSIFCFDSDVAMRLIERDLLVGVHMGEVPEDTPMVPLQQDLIRLQKRLRLKPEALEKILDLDLRNDTDRERSVLLHRLRLLDIDWGTPSEQGRGKGTFHEYWALRWDPGFTIKLIEAGVLGNTIEQAAGAKLRKLAADSKDLRTLAAHLKDAMLADLGDAAQSLAHEIGNAAAVAADVTLLMETLPPLASLIRYGNVRQTDESMVRDIVDGIVPRITVGLGGAVASLNDDAAAEMEQHLRATHAAIELLESEHHSADWFEALSRTLPHDTVHGLVRGRAARLLLDSGKIDAAEVARLLGLTLSRGADATQGARWLEGFLSGSGLLLIHDARLLALIDGWVAGISPDAFEQLVPLLRRTFSTFPAPERKQIGQMVAKRPSTGAGHGVNAVASSDINQKRAARALPLLMQILGGSKS
jgi:hypothetical protein